MYILIDLLIMHRMAEAKASAAWPQFNTPTVDYSWGYCVTIGIYIILIIHNTDYCFTTTDYSWGYCVTSIQYTIKAQCFMHRMAEALASATAWP